MQAWAAALLATAVAWEQEGLTPGEGREIMGAVDETCLERMLLVGMDLPTGYLLLEEVAEDRPYATGKAVVAERLTALGAHGLSLVRDRAQALRQLAETGLACLRRPAVFHGMPDSVKSYALPLGQHVRHARRARAKATAALGRPQARSPTAPAAPAATAGVAARQAAVAPWEAVQPT